MARQNIEDATLISPLVRAGMKFLHATVVTLADNFQLPATAPPVIWADPAGTGKDLLLPAEASSTGLFFVVVNTADAAEDITVKEDSDTTTIAVVSQNEIGLFFCNGTSWRGGVIKTT